MLGRFIASPIEDSLTAAVFSHLLHLPVGMFWEILRNACYSDQLPQNPGKLLGVVPWPSWSSKGTQNADRVVPDLFIRFSDFDLIIEAKRWDVEMQDLAQWQRELVAYANEYGGAGKAVRLLAVGGLWNTRDTEVFPAGEEPKPGVLAPGHQPPAIRCPVHMVKWSRILAECRKLERKLSAIVSPTEQDAAHGRILAHIGDLMAAHGYSDGHWFADFDFSVRRLSADVTSHLHLFAAHSKRLTTR